MGAAPGTRLIGSPGVAPFFVQLLLVSLTISWCCPGTSGDDCGMDDDEVDAIVAAAPALSERQRARLALLLHPPSESEAGGGSLAAPPTLPHRYGGDLNEHVDDGALSA